MTFLPIADRELRVRARLRSTYRFRMIVAVGAFLLVGLLVAVGGQNQAGGRYGKMIFETMAWLSFGFCLLEGARNTADCLSAEKRDGTLGLLFLTDLRSYDVVLGKLIASSLNSFYGLLAIFPCMAISLLMGGVTFAEFWRLVLVLGSTLFFSLTVGLLISAASRDERRTWSMTLGLVLGTAIVPQLLLWYRPWANTWVAWLGPAAAFQGAMDAAYGMDAERYWMSILLLQVAAWGCLIGACWILPRTWQDRVVVESRSRWWRCGPRAQAPGGFNSERRAMILGGNPAVWLVIRGQRRQTLLWLVLAVTLGGAVTAWLLTSGSLGTGIGILAVMFLLHMGLAFWVSTEACHLFAEARDAGTLELLLSTPLSAKEIVEGHYEGLKQLFLRPVAVLLTVETIMLAAQVYLLGAAEDAPWGACIAVLVAVGFVILSWALDLVAVARYGLWQGLASRKPATAVTKTVLYVLIIPVSCGVVFTLGLLLPVIGLVKNLVFINYAQEQMRRNFRPLLTGRYGWAQEKEYVDNAPPTRQPRRDVLPSVLPR